MQAHSTMRSRPLVLAGSGCSIRRHCSGFPGLRSSTPIQNASAAIIGRLSEYSGNFTFDLNGDVLPAGTPSLRTFATEEYDAYFQDTWKPLSNLTLTLGLRYGFSRPVYETKGYQVVPTVRLGDYFDMRVQSSATGVPFNQLIDFERRPCLTADGILQCRLEQLAAAYRCCGSPEFESEY